MVEEKGILRYFEYVIYTNKSQSHNSANLPKKLIGFLNAMFSMELREMNVVEKPLW